MPQGTGMAGMITDTAITTTTMADGRGLCRLLQLASPMLPIGAYGYSQGLETAIEDGIVVDAAGAEAWIADVFRFALCRFELPIMLRLHRDWSGRPDRVSSWNARLLAGRDTAETQAESLQTGYSLTRLLLQLGAVGESDAALLERIGPASLPLAFAIAARCWGIGEQDALSAYGWVWAENQVVVAMKCVPIGQVAGQRILTAVAAGIPEIVTSMADYPHEAISNFAPGLTLAGCRHEIQYSRLFRS
jgi:urease accessory protein